MLNKFLLIVFTVFSAFIANADDSIPVTSNDDDSIPVTAHIDINFSTNINLSKTEMFNENVGAVTFVFPIQQNLYKPIDNLNKQINSFSINNIKVFAPSLTGTENVSFSIRMAYKLNDASPAVPLFSINSLTSTRMRAGDYSMTKESGFSEFNSILFSDINTETSLREFSSILFVIKMKLDGSDAALIDLNNIDLQVDIQAMVNTTIKIKR